VTARQLGLYILLLMVVSVTGWYVFSRSPGLQRSNVSETGADAFVKDMNLRVMNEQGQLAYRIKAVQMTHYPAGARIHLEQPDIRINQSSGDVWLIKSEQGETTEDADVIWLLGYVDIKRRATANNAALHIVTSDLTVWPEEERAATDNAATITSDQMELYGIGVSADFSKSTLQLRSSVRGRYDGAS